MRFNHQTQITPLLPSNSDIHPAEDFLFKRIEIKGFLECLLLISSWVFIFSKPVSSKKRKIEKEQNKKKLIS